MTILVVGSVALDYLETPFGSMDKALGGAATFISIAASSFTPGVRFVGIVGGDFPEEHVDYLRSRDIDLEGLVRVEHGKTFSWGGRYHEDMNIRDTLYTELGVFADFQPTIPENWKSSEIVVLGNIHPSLQSHVLDQIKDPRIVICDTMNLWIDTSYDALLETIARVDVLILNDQEAKMLTRMANVLAAGESILGMGPSSVVIKKGEHGALLMSGGRMFLAPAYPLKQIKDPTGAGDTFAGGFAGLLAKYGDLSFDAMKRAVITGTALASFCVEEFSTGGIHDLNEAQVMSRYREIREMTTFDD